MRRQSLFALAFLLSASVAYAQDDPTEPGEENPEPPPAEVVKPKPPEEKIIVNARKPFLHARRTEIAALAGATVNDPFLVHYSAGASASYYFSDVLSVGVQGQKYFQTSTGLSGDVISLNSLPDLNQLDFYGGVHFNYIPVYGKFALLNKVVGFDTYLNLGAGVTGNRILEPFAFNSTIENNELGSFCGTAAGASYANGGFCTDENADGTLDFAGEFKNLQIALSPSIGAGVRFFVSDFMSVTFDVKDYFFQQTTLSRQNVFTQNVVVSAGTSFFFPFRFQYTTAR
jgi:outer membrane beta-barrel protein